jgi:hypothetical protein
MQRARLAQPSAAKRARAKQLNSPQGRSDLSSQRMQFFPLRSVKGLVLCPHGGSDHHRVCWELVGQSRPPVRQLRTASVSGVTGVEEELHAHATLWLSATR